MSLDYFVPVEVVRHKNADIFEDTMQSRESANDYSTAYKESIQDPEGFWGNLAKEYLLWEKQYEKVMDCDMGNGVIKWFTGGKLNVSGKKMCI